MAAARWPLRLLTGATIVWAGVLPLGTLDAGGSSPTVSSVVYAMGEILCHQRPERSFSWHGQPWPVCARCAGVYVGAAFGVVLAHALRRQALAPPARVVRLWLIAAACPALATILYEWVTGITPGHALRAATGGAMGLVAGALLVRFLREWQRGAAVPGMAAGMR